ncbi:MAG: hypothetical protein N4A37_12685 [Prolixibacteraceae bacterium]|jgi:hypothetical protein|nr:hypothetical protein [Prolixibacteraceae bacterium]
MVPPWFVHRFGLFDGGTMDEPWTNHGGTLYLTSGIIFRYPLAYSTIPFLKNPLLMANKTFYCHCPKARVALVVSGSSTPNVNGFSTFFIFSFLCDSPDLPN